MSEIKENARWCLRVDEFNVDEIKGWAFDRERPGLPVQVEVCASGEKQMVAVADRYRRDLAEAGFGNGYHAFSIDISKWGLAGDTVTVRPVSAERSCQIVLNYDAAVSLTQKTWSRKLFKELDRMALSLVVQHER